MKVKFKTITHARVPIRNKKLVKPRIVAPLATFPVAMRVG